MFLRTVRSGLEPGAALLGRHPLGYGERPVHGVQLGVAIDAAIVPDVSPGEGTKITSNIPLLFPLQKLESETAWSDVLEWFGRCMAGPEYCCRPEPRKDRSSRMRLDGTSPRRDRSCCGTWTDRRQLWGIWRRD